MNKVSMGSRIREERLKSNLTQEQLAECVNVSTAYIGQIERGERNASLEILVQIVNTLGITIDYVLEESYVNKYNDTRMLFMIKRMLEGRNELETDTAVAVLHTLLECLDRYKKDLDRPAR